MREIIEVLADEKRILDEAVHKIIAVKNGAEFDFADYVTLTEEYGKLLDELQRTTIISDTTTVDLYENNVELTDKVYFDSLTGIYNRRYLEDSLKRIAQSLKRSGDVLSVMMIDIDYFKKYNDTYGHSEGDVCLKDIAETIQSTLLRPDDFVARYGGEEFTVVLPYTDEDGSRHIAEKILSNVKKRNIPHEKSEVADHVTLSIGFTTVRAEFPQDGDEFIKKADKALYESKQNGRNQYTYTDFN